MTRIYSNTPKHYQQLSAAERGQIEASLKDGLSVMQIAQRLGRARSTIYREIARGTPCSVTLIIYFTANISQRPAR